MSEIKTICRQIPLHKRARTAQSSFPDQTNQVFRVFAALFKMNSSLLLLCASLVFVSCVAKKCRPGDNHKEEPSAEDGLAACKAYKSNSCCTAAFTSQLASSPVKGVGNFSWTPCNQNLSSSCEAFMVKVECFYRCSPNAWFWKNPKYQIAFINAPLCSSFCDSWFEACKDDLTCAKNWLTDFNMATAPSTCKTNSSCAPMGKYYTSGQDMCENIWGKSFTYKKSDCLNLDSKDDELVDRLFLNTTIEPSTVPSTTVPSSGNAVKVGFLSVTFVVALWLF